MLSDLAAANPQETRDWARHESDSISGLVYQNFSMPSPQALN